jgi:hypothetical protein
VPDPARAPIDPAAWQARLDRIGELLASIMDTATEVSTRRCPYRDRLDRCTAQFGCRNQRKPADPGEPRRCGGDDRLDYRSAWETDRAG